MAQYPAIIEFSDLDGTNGFSLDGEAAWFSGKSVASAGDVNGDGFADLIVGAPGGGAGGVSYVVFGAATGFAAHIDLSSLGGAQGFQIAGTDNGVGLGRSVASAGDVNGDGFDDVIVGAYQGTPASHLGAAYVVFGKAGGFAASLDVSSLDGTNGFKLAGVAAFDSTGFSVASAGDVNGDGFADLIVGAVGADPHGVNGSGAAYVVFGKAGGFAADLDLSSLDGSNGFRLSGAAIYDLAGRSVAPAGDLNGDGFDDVIVGAPGADPNGGNSGASYVVFGQASGFAANIDLSSLNGTNGFRLSGAAGDYSGVSVASAGDVNGDGHLDLIIGDARAASSSGASYVVFGQASGFAANIDLSSLDGGNGFRINGEQATDYSGFSAASAGDVNGDGFDDVIVGAYLAPGGAKAGAAYVVFGKASGFAANLDLSSLDGTNGFKLPGLADEDRAGFSVASAGDVNGDGLDDLIVGAPRAEVNGYGSGSSYVVFGRLPDAAVNRTGTNASQHLVGGNFNDTLSGLGGADSLYGNGGADQLNGGRGNDVLYGGAGTDQLDGGKGADAASSLYAPSLVTVSLAVGGAQNTHGAGSDTLTSIENLTGSAFDDQLTGNGGRNTLDGGAGNDLLNGGGGTDTLIGGDGIDTASYADASAGVRVSLAIKPFQNTVSAGKDKLDGIENLTGSAFDDKLTGDSHANVLDGGAGKDTLAGGNGADVFVYHTLGDSTLAAPDLITDFAAGDLIDLHAIDADASKSGNQAFHFGATQGHAGDLVVSYNVAADQTTVSLYVDGDAVADAAIRLSGDHTGLSAADFVL